MATVRTILPQLHDDPQIRRVFIEDLSLAIHVDHPGMARVIEFGSTFVAVEPARGIALRAIRERARRDGRTIPTWFTLRVLAEVARALHHAHTLTDERGEPLGILHGGLRPEVITIGAGRVKVLDLGLSRAEALAPGAWADGRLAYLAPEQTRGARTDRRADLFSLGLCLYEGLTGVQPNRGGSDRDVLRRVAAGHPPPARMTAPWLSRGLEDLLMRVLVASPGARLLDTATFAAELEAMPELEGKTRRDVALLIEELFPEEPVEAPPADAPEELPFPTMKSVTS